MPNLSWDLSRDFAPVVLMVVNNHLLAAHPSVPANNVQELIALAKAKPGQVTYASYGPGSSAHLTAELFKLMARRRPAARAVQGRGARGERPPRRAGEHHLRRRRRAAAAHQVRQAEGARHRLARSASKACPTCRPSPSPACRASRPAASSASSRPPARRRRSINALNAAAQKSLAMPEVRERLLALASPPVGGTPEQFGELHEARGRQVGARHPRGEHQAGIAGRSP